MQEDGNKHLMLHSIRFSFFIRFCDAANCVAWFPAFLVSFLFAERDWWAGSAGDRAEQLGASHQDTITSMHNLAELYRAIGDEDAAHEVQQQIMRAVDGARQAAAASAAAAAPSDGSDGDGERDTRAGWQPP